METHHRVERHFLLLSNLFIYILQLSIKSIKVIVNYYWSKFVSIMFIYASTYISLQLHQCATHIKLLYTVYKYWPEEWNKVSQLIMKIITALLKMCTEWKKLTIPKCIYNSLLFITVYCYKCFIKDNIISTTMILCSLMTNKKALNRSWENCHLKQINRKSIYFCLRL